MGAKGLNIETPNGHQMGKFNLQTKFECELLIQSSLRQGLNQLETFLGFISGHFLINKFRFGNMKASLNEALANAIIHGNKYDASKNIVLSTRINKSSVLLILAERTIFFEASY